jgi:myxalamid-type polyketide synthase MxaB
VDLERAPAAAQAAALYEELVAPSAERQIALRGEDRYVARLTPAPRDTFPELPLPGGPFVLQPEAKGDLDRLSYRPSKRRQLGPREVEIEVHAAGLNFLDVLDALGALPFERGWLGGECAGVVSAVGSGVEEFQVGDPVVALARGSFGSHAVADVRVTARKPSPLTFAQAAAFPVTFLTAQLALDAAGGVRPGERVLIHAISGGTGMAAWQLARRAGAEVLGTASPGKWAALRTLGIAEPMNSRTTTFEAEVAARTSTLGVEVVMNSLTGDFIPAGLRALAPGGRFIEIGKTGIWTGEQVRQLRPDVRYQVVDLYALSERDPAAVVTMLRGLAAAFEDGSLLPAPVTEFPARRAVAAFRTMQQARHIGKIAISMALSPDPGRFHSDATYLVAGGTSELGLLTADWLAARGAGHVVLVSRRARETAFPDRVRQLRDRGCAVTLAAIDIANREAVAGLLRNIARDLPPLRGIVHAAGLLDDGLLTELEWPRFERVLAPKVEGAWNLHELTLGTPLDFFVAYSSIASVFGSAAQTHHAAANRFLDALMAFRRHEGLPGLSINWGPWSELGGAARLSPAMKERQRQFGLGAIPTAQGRALLDRLWRHTGPAIAVAPVDWTRYGARVADQPFFEEFLKTGRAPQAAKPDNVTGLRGEPLRRRLHAALLEELRAVLGQPADWTPDEEQGFFAFGMDSLTSLELRNRLQNRLGAPLPVTALFDHASPAQLVEHLALRLEPSPEGAAPARSGREAELDGMGAEELASLLSAKLAAMDSMQ